MAKKWIETSTWGNFIDPNSEVGFSYQEVPRFQCPNCKEIYPTNRYFSEANYCPNCGEKLNI